MSIIFQKMKTFLGEIFLKAENKNRFVSKDEYAFFESHSSFLLTFANFGDIIYLIKLCLCINFEIKPSEGENYEKANF